MGFSSSLLLAAMDLWPALRGTRRSSENFPVAASNVAAPGARFGGSLTLA
jgi:hypothetical protein